jgi:hypothetical protein
MFNIGDIVEDTQSRFGEMEILSPIVLNGYHDSYICRRDYGASIQTEAEANLFVGWMSEEDRKKIRLLIPLWQKRNLTVSYLWASNLRLVRSGSGNVVELSKDLNEDCGGLNLL